MSSEKWHTHNGGGRPRHDVYDERGTLVCIGYGPNGVNIAAQIVREHNAHDALVEALEALLTSEHITHSNPCQEQAVESLLKQTAPKCRCGRDPMVEQARAALALAKGDRDA